MDEKDRVVISRILRKRRIANDTFSYICSIAPGKTTSDDIAYRINASKTSVLGALRGLGTRYKKEESLVHFGLADFEKKTRGTRIVILYGATTRGLMERGLAGNHSRNNPRKKIKL
jgi:predicted transcriptional regulator with HTH domain